MGALRTKGIFEQLYGRFEIRCQLPTQPGWWVAFWMMQGNVSSVGNGAVDGGEISTQDWAINNWWANDPADATYPDSFLVDKE